MKNQNRSFGGNSGRAGLRNSTPQRRRRDGSCQLQKNGRNRTRANCQNGNMINKEQTETGQSEIKEPFQPGVQK